MYQVAGTQLYVVTFMVCFHAPKGDKAFCLAHMVDKLSLSFNPEGHGSGLLNLGASQNALKRYYQWSSLLIWDAVDVALDRNKSYLDLLRGDEPYKLRWSSEVVSAYRLLLGRRRAVWAPYAGYHALHSKARWYAKSEDSPQWVKSAADKYREVRYKVTRYVKRA